MESENSTPNRNSHTDIRGNINTGGGDFVARDKIIQQHLDPDALRDQRNLAALRKTVSRFWIDGVLKHSLYNEVLIRLGLDARPQAVDNRPWKLALQQSGQPDAVIADDIQVVEIFDKMGQQLLILGEPGSGKTTTLLTLADALLARADADMMLPTPVLFNLSSWTETYPQLEEWLSEELNTRYQIPQKVAKQWVKDDELLLLLDGLDEVSEANRAACVIAINAFRQKHVVGLAVCSRTTEYGTLAKRLKLAAAVVVRPLTLEQIEAYVVQSGEPAAALSRALAESSELRELAQTPLMLSVMMLAYHNQVTNDDMIDVSRRSERQTLLDRYIRRMFEHRELVYLYAPQQSIKWLRWLAGQMVDRNQSQFLIERLQPDWLAQQSDINLYLLSSGLIFALIVALSAGLIVGLGSGSSGGLIFALLAGLSAGLIVGLIFGVSGGLSSGLNRNIQIHETQGVFLEDAQEDVLSFGLLGGPNINIQAHEAIKFSWKNGLRIGLVGGLIGGLIGGLSVGLSGELIDGPIFTLIDELIIELGGGLLFGLIGGLIFALIGGLSGGLIFALIGRLSGHKKSVETKLKVRANQGIWQSLENGLILGLLGGLSGGLSGGLLGGLSGGLIFALIGGLGGGLSGGLNSCIKHWLLRSLLYREGRMPWNYARFLNYAAARLFLRKVGSNYVFIHRLVLEHFADLTDEDIQRITAGLD